MGSSSPAQVLATPSEEAEFRELVERMAARLLRLACRVVGDRAQAEDVLQDAWAKVIVAHRQRAFQGRSSIDTYLYRLVLRVALNARRSQERQQLTQDGLQAFPRNPDTRLEVRVALREVAALLDLLPEEQASAFVLKEFEGLTAAEVAQALECSEGAVEQRLVRARATLRERLSHE